MPPDSKNQRPDYPTEAARRAQRTALYLLSDVLDYLRSVDGAETSFVRPAEEAIARLEGLEIPMLYDEVVPQEVLDALREAVSVAQDVVTMTRIDEPPNPVLVGPRLQELERETSAAAATPPPRV